MATETPRWKVKEPVLLNEVIGRHEVPGEEDEIVLRGFIAIRGQIIEGKELEPAYVKRYEDGDPATRAQVELLEAPGSSAVAQGDGLYDPSDHSVEDVNSYLNGADEEERERVVLAEMEGKARKSIVERGD